MIYSFTAIAYAFFTLTFGVFCWRLYQYWEKEKNKFVKYLFFGAIFFLLFGVVVTLRIFFFKNAPISVDSMIALGALFQTIAFSFLAYTIFYLKIPKVSPWVGVIPVFILGLASSFMSLSAESNPYIDDNYALNWGFKSVVPFALILRGCLAALIFIPILLIFFQQLKESKDAYTKRKSMGFIVMFLLVSLVSILDFFVINIFGLRPIWRDIALIFLSFVIVFINLMSFRGSKKTIIEEGNN